MCFGNLCFIGSSIPRNKESRGCESPLKINSSKVNMSLMELPNAWFHVWTLLGRPFCSPNRLLFGKMQAP